VAHRHLESALICADGSAPFHVGKGRCDADHAEGHQGDRDQHLDKCQAVFGLSPITLTPWSAHQW
jgi:hypothetical protein